MAQTHTPPVLSPTPTEERGSVLIVVLVAMLGVGAMTLAHLTQVVAENNRIRTMVYADRAQTIADAQLELAKNIVNAAVYVDDVNTAITAAMDATPPCVPGTAVEVTKVGGTDSDWYMLRAEGVYRGFRKTSQTMLRQRSPVSAYNFLVASHPLGISGAPRGAIHSNASVDFYFPWGRFQDSVTAADGFNYRAGATPENTRLLGPWNPAAGVNEMLDNVDISSLQAKAKLAVTDDLIAEVEFQADQTEIKLFNPSHSILVPYERDISVFDHYESQRFDVREPVYVDVSYTETVPDYERQAFEVTRSNDVYVDVDVTYTETVPVYEDRTVTWNEEVPVYGTRTVTVERTRQVWVEDPPPPPSEIEGGFAVAAEAPTFGHWETMTYQDTEEERYQTGTETVTRSRVDRVQTGTETVTRTRTESQYSHTDTWTETEYRDVQVGSHEEARTRREFSHYETVERWYDVPIYRTETMTFYRWVRVPEELVRTETTSTDGLVYIESDIRKIGGTVNGQMSIVTNDDVNITNSIVYVDDSNETRMLHGTDPSQRYQFNPDYRGDSVLAIMARDDIRYDRDGPSRLEINASLIAVQGAVRFEGISVSSDGQDVSARDTSDSNAVKESIRRLGGIVCDERPVTTYVDATNQVLAGYQKGVSFMDKNLLMDGGGTITPPFMFMANRPSWSLASGGRRFQVEP